MIDLLVRSVAIAGLASVAVVAVGVPFARLLARRRGLFAELLSTLVLLPMILPPTVLGYILLLLVGRGSPIGQTWEALTGAPLVFTPAAAVLAAFVAALPFLVRAAQSAFEQIDPHFEDVARTLGRTELDIFLRVSIPLARRGIVGGAALAFARAMGEFGATAMIAGSIPGRTQTASLAVYDAVQAGRTADAGLLALVLALLSATILFAVGRTGSR